MSRTGRFQLGQLTLRQLADLVDRCKDLGYGPTARVAVVLEVTDPRAPENVPSQSRADSHDQQETTGG